MSHKVLIDGTSYNANSGAAQIDGTNYNIKKGRTLIGGACYDVSFGTPVSNLAVGDSVFMNVDSVLTEFLVVHKGIPTRIALNVEYDASCDGVWLVMKDIYTTRKFSSDNTLDNFEYSKSSMHTYVNNTFFGKLDSVAKSAIKTVKLPYVDYDYNGNGAIDVFEGENGLEVRTFLLSARELNKSGDAYFSDGNPLDYFKSNSAKAYYNGTATAYWTRSMDGDGYDPIYIDTSGLSELTTLPASRTYGVRPACIIYHETLIDSNTHTIIGL